MSEREAWIIDGVRTPRGKGKQNGALHHIHPHPRDDVEANLIMLCGSGTTGHHGAIQHRERWARDALRAILRASRPDFIGYLAVKLRSPDAAREWIDRVL